MTAAAILYHKEYAGPEGRRFEAEDVATLERLIARRAEEGWVDNPAKVGINAWPGMDAEERVAKIAKAYERGKVKAIDDHKPLTQEDIVEAEQRISDIEAREKALDEREAELARQKKKLEQTAHAQDAMEQQVDSDSVRKGKREGTQVTKPKDTGKAADEGEG